MNQAAKRYGIFASGVVVSALGISLITKAGLGTSPITSLSYVLSYIFPFSLGVFVMAVNCCMFLIQMLLQGKDFQRLQFLQIPATLLFSVFIDIWLFLFSGWELSSYLEQMAVLFLGCGFLGLGIALEVIPNVLILPAEGVVRTIAGLKGWHFGHVKVAFDLGMVVSAMIVSLLVKGEIWGVREGTMIAAFIVGHISGFFIRQISRLLSQFVPAYAGHGGILADKNA